MRGSAKEAVTNLQAPTSNNQGSFKVQISNLPAIAVLGGWCLVILWMLDVGCWSFSSALSCPW